MTQLTISYEEKCKQYANYLSKLVSMNDDTEEKILLKIFAFTQL